MGPRGPRSDFMPDTEDLEDLDAELARLEAELAALEGEDSSDKKRKGAGSSLKALKGKLPFSRSDDGDDEPEDPSGAESAPGGDDDASTRDRPDDDAPASGKGSGDAPRKRLGLPLFGGKKDDAAAEPAKAKKAHAPTPEGFDSDARWDRDGPRWRRSGGGPADGGDVVLRRVDLEGNVVEEAPTDDPEVVKLARADAAKTSPLRKRLGLPASLTGLRRGGGDAHSAEGDDGDGDDGESGRKRRLIIPLVAVAALVLLALLLPALAGVDPTGLGAKLGIGGGGGAIQADIAMTPGGGVAAAGDSITFDASGTTDEAGRDLVFTWDMGDGTTREGAQVRHAYAAPDTYTVTLTVAAGRATAEATRTVTVLSKPVAAVGFQVAGSDVSEANPAVAGEAVTLTASGSTADGVITQYQWATSDGGSYTGATASHAFANPGMHTVTLTVTDDAGLTAEASRMVHVGWRGVFNDTAPASVQGESSGPSHAFVTNHEGMMPVRVVLELTYAAPDALPTGDAPPGGELMVSVADADGALVAEAMGTNGTAFLEITEFTGSLGEWTATVKREQGGAEDKAYEVTVTVAYPPFM